METHEMIRKAHVMSSRNSKIFEDIVSTVPKWIAELRSNEVLVVGIPLLTDKWDELCLTYGLFRQSEADFISMLTENQDVIFPACPIDLSAQYACIIIDDDCRLDAASLQRLDPILRAVLTHYREQTRLQVRVIS